MTYVLSLENIGVGVTFLLKYKVRWTRIYSAINNGTEIYYNTFLNIQFNINPPDRSVFITWLYVRESRIYHNSFVYLLLRPPVDQVGFIFRKRNVK